MIGGLGACCKRSAEPESDVDELLPCLAIINNADARIDAVVDTLYVLCPSPPVPTMSHCNHVSIELSFLSFRSEYQVTLI